MDSTSDEEPHNNKMKSPPLPSLLSLPDELIFSCLARVSKWDHLNLSLVSKTFHSLMASPELHTMRALLGLTEHWLYVCVRMPFEPSPRWFALCSTTGNQLVQIPLCPFELPDDPCVVALGSDIYVIGGISNEKSTSSVFLFDSQSFTWRCLPNMRMPRKLCLAGVVDGKIYVIGGCGKRSICMGEMFDPDKQTWEPLPYTDLSFHDGGLSQFSSLRHSVVMDRKVYVMVCFNCFSYKPEDGQWETVPNQNLNGFQSSVCVIENVLYSCDFSGVLLWHDFEDMRWKAVKGIEALPRFLPVVKLADYGGNLAVFSERPMVDPPRSQIWCTEIVLVRRNKEEIWGKVEWSKAVFTFTGSCYRPDILHCVAVTV